MSRRRRRNRRPQQSPIERAIYNEANKKGLERVLYGEMSRIARDHDRSIQYVVCGYACQPIFYNQEEQEMIYGCVLDKSMICRQDVPSEKYFISEDCPIYKREVLK